MRHPRLAGSPGAATARPAFASARCAGSVWVRSFNVQTPPCSSTTMRNGPGPARAVEARVEGLVAVPQKLNVFECRIPAICYIRIRSRAVVCLSAQTAALTAGQVQRHYVHNLHNCANSTHCEWLGVRDQVSAEEWKAREELAAVFRLAALEGWADLAMAHASARVPGTTDQFLFLPTELTFDEMTASSRHKVDADGQLLIVAPARTSSRTHCRCRPISSSRKRSASFTCIPTPALRFRCRRTACCRAVSTHSG